MAVLKDSDLALFRDIARDLFLRGLVSSHAGNISLRMKDRMCITKTGCMLGRSNEKDLVELDMEHPGEQLAQASSEFIVHRAIYRLSNAQAVLHAHPPYATLLSMLFDEIAPVDSEGSHLFTKVPVVSAANTVGSDESARVVSEALRENRIVMLRGHGSFARGGSLEEAYMLTSSLEAASFYVYHLESVKDRKITDKYKTW
jgi:L-fuculose-phosphate aldolase